MPCESRRKSVYSENKNRKGTYMRKGCEIFYGSTAKKLGRSAETLGMNEFNALT